MKRLILITLLIFVYQFSYAKYLIRENDKYVAKDWATNNLSFADVAEHLGCNSKQFFHYRDKKIADSGIHFVIMELISSKVLFLYVDNNVEEVSQKQVDDYLVNFKYQEKITPWDYASRLEKAVDSLNFSLDFFVKALGVKCNENCKDTTLIDTKNKYKYIFKNGILVEYIPTDGYGEMARFYEQGNYFPLIKQYAESYWKGNKKMVIWEINTQCNALAQIPSGFSNEYCYMFAEYNDKVFNAKIMTVALYGDTDITEKEFVNITHNRAKNDGLMSYYGKNCKRYCYKGFYFLFENDGKFYKVVEQN